MRVADVSHPFYKPLWRRVILVAVIGAWACYENFVVKDPMWMVLTGGVFVYSAWMFLIRWQDAPAEAADQIEDASSKPTPAAAESDDQSSAGDGVDRN